MSFHLGYIIKVTNTMVFYSNVIVEKHIIPINR